MSINKKKIAVLGGGTGSLAAVWALTELPDWKDRYEITVHQMGWRLGGKGASGRNDKYGNRIEEHGLHVWAGFYDNAFRLIRKVYEEWEVKPDNPFQSWRDAFKPQSHVIVEEFIRGNWLHWQVDWPPAPGEPGDDEDNATDVWGYILKILDWLVAYLADSDLYDGKAEHYGGATALWMALRGAGALLAGNLPGVLRAFDPTELIRAARDLAYDLDRDVFKHVRADHLRLIAILEMLKSEIEEEFLEELDEHTAARRLYYLIDMSLGTIKGLLLDGVIFRGWNSIDFWEWRDWMRRWGVSDYTINGVLARGVYDYVFGYPNGNTHFARSGAGTAIHGALRLVFTYRGAMFYFMQAGMGDVVFSPLYEVLRARGVKFEFFHKVENLGLDSAGEFIDRITITKQATLKPSLTTYEPLLDIKGVPSWPSHPLYDQLVEGVDLELQEVNLESNWSSWPGVGQEELVRGVDFDEVILGIPCTSFPYIAKELMTHSEPFEQMVFAIQSTQTQAVQLWFNKTAMQLGAPDKPVVATAYVDPINTWADMSHLLKRESWMIDGEEPEFVAYFCGPMEDALHIAAFSDHDFPRRELDRVKQTAVTWLSGHSGHIWTKSGTSTNPAGLNWDLLHGEGSGLMKMESQYYRANIDPSERYILSVPGSVQLRMKAKGSVFKNLTMTGDWVYTSLSAGCIECCAMAGLHAAEAISGEKFYISDRGYDSWKQEGEV